MRFCGCCKPTDAILVDKGEMTRCSTDAFEATAQNFFGSKILALSRIGSGNGLMENMGFSHGNINIDLNGSLRKITPRLRGTCRPRTAVGGNVSNGYM